MSATAGGAENLTWIFSHHRTRVLVHGEKGSKPCHSQGTKESTLQLGKGQEAILGLNQLEIFHCPKRKDY